MPISNKRLVSDSTEEGERRRYRNEKKGGGSRRKGSVLNHFFTFSLTG